MRARVGLRPRTVHSVGNPVQPIFPSNILSIQVLQDFRKVNTVSTRKQPQAIILIDWACTLDISTSREHKFGRN